MLLPLQGRGVVVVRGDSESADLDTWLQHLKTRRQAH